jgi:hypothetical protein
MMRTFPEELKPLASYFEKLYPGTSVVKPLFPIQFWNVFDRVFEGITKTSNFFEGFHNKLNRNLVIKRPPMWRFMFNLNNIQRRCENSIAKVRAPDGLPRIQRKKYRLLNEKLLAVCNSYDNNFKTVIVFQKVDSSTTFLCPCLS